MGTFINNNRGKLSIIAIAVAFLLAWLASFLPTSYINLVNWLIFIACILTLGFINFADDIVDFDVLEEHAPGYDYERGAEPQSKTPSNEIEFGDKNQRDVYIDSLKPKQKLSFWDSKKAEINQPEIKMKDNKNPEAPKAEVTEKQPEIVIAPTFREETSSENNAPSPEPVDDGKPKPEGVKGYSLHNIHKRWRPMYQDVCSYAISTVKSESELDAVVNRWGNKNTKVRAGSNLVAYVVEHGLGNIRIPEAGFFEIK